MPADADLVIIGNPTNPTGVLHPAELLRRLVRPGRLLVIDEAFMDAVPGEPESMITGGSMDGVLVLRSLTKTWGLAGLRAGYAVGDPAVITELARQQPPWSVSTPAAAAMIACVSATARAVAAAAAEEITRRRDHLLAGLTDLGSGGRAGRPGPPSSWSIPAAGCPVTTSRGPCAYACGSVVSRSAAARRSPVWEPTGSGSPSATRRPPTR